MSRTVVFYTLIIVGLWIGASIGAVIEISQPIYGTSNNAYDRNPSVVEYGGNYWLFYAKGDDTSTNGVRGGGYAPDNDGYVIWYKTASTIEGLAAISETKLDSSETFRPTGFDQRVVTAVVANDGTADCIYAIVSSGFGGSGWPSHGMYHYKYDGLSWTGPVMMVDPLGPDQYGAHVNAASDGNSIYIVWDSNGQKFFKYTPSTDVLPLASPTLITTGNMPKITLMGTTIYVVGIATSGDIDIWSSPTSPIISWGYHSTAIPGAGQYDPCIFNDGAELYVVTAPWVPADRQYLIQARTSGGGWVTDKVISYGGYRGVEWWDYWPCGYFDGADLWLFFATETNSPEFSDAEIAFAKIDWDLDNNHYFYIQNAIDKAVTGDVVNVPAGTYAEYLHITTDGITIQGAGIDQTVLDLDGLIPFWEYGMASSSFAGRGGVLISGYGNTGGEADLVENVTFKDFTVKNAGENTPKITGAHTGLNDDAILTDNTASWETDELVGQWIANADDYIDNSGGRQFYRAQITANTATTVTMSYISGGDEMDWDNGDAYIITSYREWYDGALDGRDDVRGIIISSGRDITIQSCKVQSNGNRGISAGRSRISPRTPSQDITITGCEIIDNHNTGIGTGDTYGTITITGNTVSNNNNPTTEGCTYSGSIGPPDCHVNGMHIGGRGSSQLLTGTISGNTVNGNAYHGITVYKYTDGILVENNIVTGQNLNSEGAGIFVSTGWGFDKHCKNHTVRNNIVTGNIRGIVLYYAWGDNPGDLVIEDNTVSTNSGTFDAGQAAIKLDNAYNAVVRNNSLSSLDGLGIELTGSSTTSNTIGAPGYGNSVSDALFAGVYIRSGAYDNAFNNNLITGTTSKTSTQYADWGSHTGASGSVILEDNTKSWTPDAYVGFTVLNLNDGSSGAITANTATTITATLSGGDNVWDTSDDYDIVYEETKAVGIFLRGGFCYASGHAGIDNVFNENAVYGNAGEGIENQTAALVDASSNWWGNTDPATVDALVVGNVDYSPWLGGGTETNPGFEGDFSELWVDDSSPQTGSLGYIEEGLDLVDGSTINIAAGTYNESIVFNSGFDKDGLTITGDETDRPVITSGVRFLQTADLDGFTLENLYLKGVASGANMVFDMDNSGAVNDFSMDNCVIDGENISGQPGFGGQNLGQSFSITNTEFKDILGWAVMDIESGSGDGGCNLPFTTVAFNNNNVHECNGSVSLRGNASDLSDEVSVYGNTFGNIGGNQSEQGQHWAAFEVNHALAANIYDNDIDNVIEGEWGEGQGIQLWDIGMLDMYNNTITNCFQGLFIFGGIEGGVYGGPYAIPGGHIYHNTFSGNDQYNVSVETTCTGTSLDARQNYWGIVNCVAITATILGSVSFDPWCNSDFSRCDLTCNLIEAWVDNDWTGPANCGGHIWQYDAFDVIQDGVDAVSSGGTVHVMNGSYGADPATGRCVYITKDGLSLLGESEIGVIIDGAIDGVGGSSSYWPKGIHVQANNVTIQNLTVQGFTGDGISTGGYGVLHRDYAHDTPGEGYIFYTGCIIDNVTVQYCYSAIYALCFTYHTVSNCTVLNNQSDGMFIARGSDYATIHDNVVTNSGDHGIWVGKCWSGLDPSDDAVIYNNYVNGAREGGISFVGSDSAEIYGNTITNVASEGWAVGGLSLKDGPSNVNAHDNTIFECDSTWSGNHGFGHGVGIDGAATNITLFHNKIYDNNGYGVYNLSTLTSMGTWTDRLDEDKIPDNAEHFKSSDPVVSSRDQVNAEYNWWGAYCGPYHLTLNPGGEGDEVSDNVDFAPWCDETFTKCDFDTVIPDEVWVNANYGAGLTNDGHYWCYDAYNMIMPGIHAVADDGIVHVAAGTYPEQVVINKSMTLEGTNDPVINPQEGRSLQSFTIEESSRTFYPMIFAYGGINDGLGNITGTGTIEVTITGFDIDGNNSAVASTFTGMLLRNCISSEISHNDFYELLFSSGNPETGGIMVYGNSDVLVEYNTVNDWTRVGISVNGDNGPLVDPTATISNNTVAGEGPLPLGNWAQNGIQIGYGAVGSVTGNEVSDIAYIPTDWAATGITIYMAGSGLIVSGNNVHDCEAGIYPNYTDDLTISGNMFSQIEFNMVLGGNNITIDGNTFNTCEQALYIGDATNVNAFDNSFTGNDYAIMADGVCANLNFTGNNITASAICGVYLDEYYGSPTGVTVNSNNISGNAFGFINNTTVLADAEANWWGDASGPAMGTYSLAGANNLRPQEPALIDGSIKARETSSSRTVNKNTARSSDSHVNLLADGTGNAVTVLVDYSPWWGDNYVDDDHTSTWNWWVDISNSSSIQEGIDYALGSDTVFVTPAVYTGSGNKEIDFNGKDIVLTSSEEIDNTIIDCEFSGRAFYFQNGETENAVVSGFTIKSGSVVDYGGAFLCVHSSSPTIMSCLIINNHAGCGGGIFIGEANPTIINCTISGNSASGAGIGSKGGGIYCDITVSAIKNTIFWANIATGGGNQIYGSLPVVTYCDIEGDYPGMTNIDVDPLFRDALNGDFHLMSIACGDTIDSPVIDAGHPNIHDAIIDCSHGLGDVRADIGAYGGVIIMTGLSYLPGDANMYNGQWPPSVIGGDVTYMVNYFRNIETSIPCYLEGFWCSADINGDCNIIGSDVTRLVNYFRGISDIRFCLFYPPLWLKTDDAPYEMPEGWPNCEIPVYGSGK